MGKTRVKIMKNLVFTIITITVFASCTWSNMIEFDVRRQCIVADDAIGNLWISEQGENDIDYIDFELKPNHKPVKEFYLEKIDTNYYARGANAELYPSACFHLRSNSVYRIEHRQYFDMPYGKIYVFTDSLGRVYDYKHVSEVADSTNLW
jgi:hypothetical protein